MEVLKILFNITFNKGKRSVDEVQKNVINMPYNRSTLVGQYRHFVHDTYVFI